MLAERVILKHDDVLIVTDLTGDIPAGNDAGLGVYRQDSRFLSTYELRLNGRRPTPLNYGVDRGYVATFQLTNPVLAPRHGGAVVPAQSLSVRRTRFVHEGVHERIGLQDCNRHRVVEGMRVGDGEVDFTVECDEDAGVRVAVDRRPAAVRRLELPA